MKDVFKEFGLVEKRIPMGLFDFTVLCVIGKYDGLESYIQWKFEDKDFSLRDDYEPRGWCIYCPGYCPVIWIPKKPRNPREYATLAHECLHAVYHLFDWAGIKMTRDTEEVVTHSMAHIINSILKK